MFSPSPHYNNGGYSGNSDNNPVFFKDPEEYYQPQNSYYEQTLPDNRNSYGHKKFKHSFSNDISHQQQLTEIGQTDNYQGNPFNTIGRYNDKICTDFKNNAFLSNKSNTYATKNSYNFNKNPKSFYFNGNNDGYEKYDINPLLDSNSIPEQEYLRESENFYYNDSSNSNNNTSPCKLKDSRYENGSSSFDIFDSPIKNTFSKYTGTTTDENVHGFKFDKPKTEKYHTSIKINDSGSGSSIGSQKLSSARKQLVVAAYFKSFKSLSLITILYFFCCMISVLLIISCISNDGFCFPKFEIQTSGIVEPNVDDLGILSALTMQPIYRNSLPAIEDELNLVEKFLDGLSGMVLDSSFNEQLVRDKISEIFESDEAIIFKFSNFGYCKETSNEENNICHPYFAYGLDVPSVFIKDLVYTLSSEEIEGDAEYVSNVFVENYRSLFHFLNFSQYNESEYFFYGMISSILSKVTSYATIVECILDIFLLLACVIISVVFKAKANKSLSDYKNYLFESNLKRQFDEQNYQFSRIQRPLLIITSITWVCTFLRISRISYELIYIIKLEAVLKNLNMRIIEGIKIISSGLIFDICNALIHLFIVVSLTKCIISKPWIVTASI